MTMIANPSLSEMIFVCQNMRPESRQEIFGLFPGTPEQLAAYLDAAGGYKWVGYHRNWPTALLGAYPIRQGVWGLFGFGTTAWRSVWRSVTVTAKRDMMQAVLDAGAHRAECMTLADHEETHKWLNYLGATERTEMPKAGRNGEDYVMFAWLRED